MVAKRAAKAALVFNTGIAENGGPSIYMSVVDLDEKDESSFSARVTLSTSMFQRVTAEVQ